jgi:hypothetical protein
LKEAIGLHKQRIPRRLLLVDALGATFAAAGVLALLDVELLLVSELGRAPGIGIMLVGLGVALMMAVPVWLLRQRHHSRTAPKGGPNP